MSYADSSNKKATPKSSSRETLLLKHGECIDQYRVLRLLGRGGMGTVYLARDTQLARKVALKFLQGRVDINRFVTEGRITAQFNHPNIVTLYGVGTYNDIPYMALEYVEGETLYHRLEDGVPSLEEALEMTLALVSALAEAHRREIAHLDLKPSNIIIANDGRLRILDFGLAQVTSGATVSSGGTPSYMAPEQWMGRWSLASDIWAVGVMLYEMLSGWRPFKDHESSTASLKAAVTGDVPVAALDVSVDIAVLCTNCLQRLSSERPTAEAVEKTLRSLVDKQKSVVVVRDALPRSEAPYRGLVAFDTAQSSLFFGRDAEIIELNERLRHAPVVPVIGPSGVGKSSLVRAGLIPRLQRFGGWKILEMRPGPRPFQALHACLNSHKGSSASNKSTATKRSWTELKTHPERLCLELEERTQAEKVRFLIFVDQLEEVFTLTEDPEVREAFLRAITSAADDLQSSVRVVFTLRDDYFTRASQVHPTIAEVLRRAFFLHVPGRSALIETLVGPLRQTNFSLEEDLAEMMVDDAGKQGASLPLLQFTARQLWEARDEQKSLLTKKAYAQIGGVSGALVQHGDRVLDTLGSDEIPMARDLLLRMVTTEKTRRVILLDEGLEGFASPAQGVLDILIGARLITTTRLDGKAALELAHESLIRDWGRLGAWIDAEQEDLRFLSEAKEAAEMWVRRGQQREEVWTRGALVEAETMLDKCTLPVPSLVREFINAGRTLRRRRMVQRRSLVSALMVFLVIVASVLFVQRQEANTNAARAEKSAVQALENQEAAQRQAAGARNASRLASATLNRSDPTLVLALLREMEPSGPLPTQWRSLARWATFQTISEVTVAPNKPVRGVSVSPDGTKMATVTLDGLVQIWSMDGEEPPVVLGKIKSRTFYVAFSPDGTRIATASKDKARVWRIDGTEKPLVFTGHERDVHSVEFSSDGTRIVTASRDKTARIWRADGTETPIILTGHQALVRHASFSPDGTHVVTGSADQTVRIWRSDGTGTPLVLRGHLGTVKSAFFSPDGTRIVTGANDFTVRVWSSDGSRDPLILRGHKGEVEFVAFSPDGRLIASASHDGTGRLWRSDGLGTPIVLRGHKRFVYASVFTPDGSKVVTASYDNTVRVWPVHSAKRPVALPSHPSIIFNSAFSPDGMHIVTAYGDGTARVSKADGSGTPVVLQGHQERLFSASFSPNGDRIVTASWDKTARVWNADGSGTPIVLRGHEDYLTSAAFSPDGTHIVTSSLDSTVRVWRADGSGSPLILRGHGARVVSASFSPDGRRILSASQDKTARLWSTDGSLQLVLRGHQGGVINACFSPDGTRVLTGSIDHTARVWSIDQQKADGSVPFVELRHKSPPQACMLAGGQPFSPDGRRVLTLSWNQNLRIWNADGTGTPASLLMYDIESISGVTFSPDGTRIATSFHRVENPITDKKEYRTMIWPTFERFTGLDDPELWTPTRYCPPVELRVDLLAMSVEQAQAERQRCRERVAVAFSGK